MTSSRLISEEYEPHVPREGHEGCREQGAIENIDYTKYSDEHACLQTSLFRR